MGSMDSWLAGDWELLPDGLQLMGNEIEAPAFDAAACEAVHSSAPFVEQLNSLAQRKRILTQPELEELLLLVETPEVWEPFHRDEFIEVQRHQDRTLFGGAVFVKVSGYFPGTTVDHVGHCYINFKDRAVWNKQMDGFKVLRHSHGNDLLYAVVHASPLADRDFIMFHTVLRHRHRPGLMFYSRSADDEFYPKLPSAVRATQYMAAHQLIQDEGGVRFVTTTAVDPHIPFLPRWILSLLLPSEFKRWRSAVLRRCKELRGQRVPCTSLWESDEKRPESGEVEEVGDAGTKMSWRTLTTGAPSDFTPLNDVIIEDTEQSACCCTVSL